jgi:hypothetical protein
MEGIRHSIGRIIVGDAIVWAFASVSALILFAAGFVFGPSVTTDLLMVSALLGFAVVLVLRMLVRRTLLPGGLVLAALVIADAVLMFFVHTPRPTVFVLLLIDFVAIVILAARRYEF